MSDSVSVHLLPSLFAEADVAAGLVVVVDILRASTTVTHALSSGADRVVPFSSIEQAFEFRDRHPGSVLGGERGGLIVDGFDYGNSPTDYSPQNVNGRVVGFTTTNGTRALLRSLQAAEIVVGCFANLSRVVARASGQSRPVHIVCAGTDGSITGEDVLFAGALATRLGVEGDAVRVGNDEARLAVAFWQQQVPDGSATAINACLRESQGGRNLIRLGYDADIALAAQVDTVPVLPIFREGSLVRCADD
ncbi:MAG: 2-phosphosulfolactate phosphatase [Planctomycetaceae bacterium]|nr:2-phosphosulfolactate phosphatase [Planctomycetaceae bacterium]